MRYVLIRCGPLLLGVNQAGSFVRFRPDVEHQNLQLFFSPVSYTKAPPGKSPLMNPDPFPGFLISAQPIRPTRRGRLKIRSADPSLAPAIYPNYLATKKDVLAMLEGERVLRRFAETPALARLIKEKISPSLADQTEEDMIADFRQRAGTVFHPVSTCRMGSDSRQDVVDARLRLHGVGGLRVVDAWILPRLTSGKTNALAIMVREKGADMILQDCGVDG